jgi:hypothetical protein
MNLLQVFLECLAILRMAVARLVISKQTSPSPDAGSNGGGNSIFQPLPPHAAPRSRRPLSEDHNPLAETQNMKIARALDGRS